MGVCWDCAIKDLGWGDKSVSPADITAAYDKCSSTALVHPGGAFVASRLLLIKRVQGPLYLGKIVAHALRTLPEKENKWMAKGWNNTWLGKAPEGKEFNFLDYMDFKDKYWRKKGDPCLYEIKLLTAEGVPK